MQAFLESAQLVSIGIATGIGLGYLKWRLRHHRDQVIKWWQPIMEKRPGIRAEIQRIEGAFRLDRFVPIQEPEFTWGERVLNWLEPTWDRFRVTTALCFMECSDLIRVNREVLR